MYINQAQGEGDGEAAHSFRQHLGPAGEIGGIGRRQIEFSNEALNLLHRLTQRQRRQQIRDHRDFALAVVAVDLRRAEILAERGDIGDLHQLAVSPRHSKIEDRLRIFSLILRGAQPDIVLVGLLFEFRDRLAADEGPERRSPRRRSECRTRKISCGR
jgi:hypothetical protein